MQCHRQRCLVLDLSRWTEWLSCGLLLSKIGSSLRSAKLHKLPSLRKRPFCGCNTARSSSSLFIVAVKILHASFPTVGFSSKCRLQRGVVLSQVNISIQICSADLLENIWEYLKVSESIWKALKLLDRKRNSLCLSCPCCYCWIELDKPSTRSWQESASLTLAYDFVRSK